MDRQAKFKAQTANSRFADGSADRLPVAGTVSRGTAIDPKMFSHHNQNFIQTLTPLVNYQMVGG